MKEHRMVIARSLRFFTEGSPDAPKRLIVLHGYGQLPEYFIRQFSFLKDHSVYVVAPEGLHRFYLNGFSGRVGASWMTRHDRLQDIADQVAYLDNLIAALHQQNPSAKLGILGFSQGVATAIRWIHQGSVKPDLCISWAGTLPPDVPYDRDAHLFSGFPFYCLTGDEDDLVQPSGMAYQLQMLKPLGNFVESRYSGGHKIAQDILIKLLQEAGFIAQ
jgi:predicted esterase